MKILGIETSCDETAVCIIETKESNNGATLTVLGNQLYSQIELHRQYGGVFPMMAKREHAKNLIPLFEKCLKEAGLIKLKDKSQKSKEEENLKLQILRTILEREGELFDELKKLLETIEKPNIDAIAVTNGPGLEPALWVGVTFAKALGEAWNVPIIPTNHMEGHILAATLEKVESSKYQVESINSSNLQSTDHNLPSTKYKLQNIIYPAIALLISGGHTQLVLIKSSLNYEIVGSTCDDAVGEAYDKVARMLGLPYPGGPQISKYADEWKKKNITKQTFKFPRPMIHSKDLNFSFSGLKTSVLYTLKEIKEITPEMKQEISYEFQNAVIDVIASKTKEALIKYSGQSLIVGGGVIANKDIRITLEKLANELGVEFLIPEISASTDNALMIAVAGYINIIAGKKSSKDFKATGNLSLL